MGGLFPPFYFKNVLDLSPIICKKLVINIDTGESPMTEQAAYQARLEASINRLMDTIKQDYYNWTLRNRPVSELSEINLKMIQEFNESLTYSVGQKYIKIMREGSAVWGFIVNTDFDKKFNRGDILKAASWNTPARNKPRGNILLNDFSWVRWTGPEYL